MFARFIDGDPYVLKCEHDTLALDMQKALVIYRVLKGSTERLEMVSGEGSRVVEKMKKATQTAEEEYKAKRSEYEEFAKNHIVFDEEVT